MIYIAVILLCRVAQHMCGKTSSKRVNGIPCFLKYAAFRNLLSAALAAGLIVISGNGFHCDAKTVIISMLSGISLTASMIFGIMALKNGTVALNSMFGTAGLIVPVIAGIFLFDTPVSILQWLGVALFLCAAYLLISNSKRTYNKFSPKTLLLLLGVLLTEGFTMLAQQLFAHYVQNGDVTVFSLFSFGIPGIAIVIYLLIKSKIHNEGKIPRLTPELIGLGAVLSLAVFIINQLATLAASVVSPVVLFAFINGGSTIIGTIVAAIMFKEKLTLRNVAGVIIGVLALVIVKCF